MNRKLLRKRFNNKDSDVCFNNIIDMMASKKGKLYFFAPIPIWEPFLKGAFFYRILYSSGKKPNPFS